MPRSKTLPYVRRFARVMEAKLEANRHKGDRPGWMKEGLGALLERLEEEVDELRDVLALLPANGFQLASPELKEEILGEAADVANFAMMVADRAHAMPLKRRAVRR